MADSSRTHKGGGAFNSLLKYLGANSPLLAQDRMFASLARYAEIENQKILSSPVNMEGRVDTPSSRKRHRYTDYMNREFGDMKIVKEVGTESNPKTITIRFENAYNQHLYSDAQGRRATQFGVRDLPVIAKLLKQAKSTGDMVEDKKDYKLHKEITHFHYFKVEYKGKPLYINVARKKEGDNIKFVVYSVTNSIRKNA